ncbi:MAG: lipid II flippase MurJ, partial [Verrucomicrobiales bacterium]
MATPVVPGILGKVLLALFTAGAMALLVKVVAFGKDLVVASRFGTSGVMDAFLIAYLAPAVAVYLLGCVPDAVIPVYLRMRAEEDRSAVERFIANVLGRYLIVLAVVMLLGYAVSSPLVGFLARKLELENRELALFLFRLLLPFVFFSSLCQIWANVLQAHRRFAVPAVSPVTIPLCVLGGLLLSGERWGVVPLVVGTLAGSLLQVVILATHCQRVCRFSLPRLDPAGVDSPRLARIALPLIAGEALVAASIFIDGSMASQLGEGNISTLTYADKVFSAVVMLATTALGQVVFPYLADFAAKREWEALRHFFLRFCGMLSAAAVLAAALLFLWAEPVVRILFERGAFDAGDTERVAAVLRFCTPQLPFLVIGVVANRALVSMERGHLLIAVTVVSCLC